MIGGLYHAQWPPVVQQMFGFLPHFLALTLLALAIYFNTARLFYCAAVVVLVWAFPWLGWDGLPKELLLIWALMVIGLVWLLPERGLLSWAAWPSHILVLILVGLAIGLVVRKPDWLNGWQALLSWPSDLSIELAVSPATTGLAVVLMLAMVFAWWRGPNNHTLNGLLAVVAVWLLTILPTDVIRLLVVNALLLVLLFNALHNAWHLAYVDELTALPGRRALQERLQRALGIYALAMVDVDHFKQFNDRYGHDVGDDVLRMIAAKIGLVSGGGLAYRYGGEEFTIVFPNHGADEVKAHLQALIQTVADTPFVVNRRQGQKPQEVQVTISIGLTDSIGKAHADQTIKIADQALYTAKKKGRNRLQLKH